MNPKVSITLCCYNSERYLEETLQSIIGQSYRNWELVIVNDGSIDNTESIIRRHIADGVPIVYRYQQNAGLGASRNRAIGMAAGDLVALIDHDDLWESTKLERQVSLFTNPRVGLVYSGARVIGHHGQRLREFMPLDRMARGDVLEQLVLGPFLACSTLVMRRSVLDEVGPFRQDLAIAEEYELMFRIAEKYEFDFVPEPLMSWRLHAMNATWNFRRAREETAAVLRDVFARHPELEKRLGQRVVTLRMAGFSCTPRQARMLGDLRNISAEVRRVGSLAAFREIAAPLAKYAVASLPLPAVDAAQRLLAKWRKHVAVT